MHDLTCAEVFDSAPQFALDILEPGRRSDVAAHLIRCGSCRETVTGMQESAAALLDLDGADWSCSPIPAPGPAPEPPPAIGSHPAAWSSTATPAVPPAQARRRFRLVVTVAAAALLMVGSTFGPEIAAATHHGPVPVARAQLWDGTRSVGVVNFYSGRSPALDLQILDQTARGQVLFETVNLDGTVTRLGAFALDNGRGYWAMADPIDVGRVSSLMLVDGQGRVLASASLNQPVRTAAAVRTA